MLARLPAGKQPKRAAPGVALIADRLTGILVIAFANKFLQFCFERLPDLLLVMRQKRASGIKLIDLERAYEMCDTQTRRRRVCCLSDVGGQILEQ